MGRSVCGWIYALLFLGMVIKCLLSTSFWDKRDTGTQGRVVSVTFGGGRCLGGGHVSP